MKYTVHAGHNPDGKSGCGAIGYIKESTQNRVVTAKVIALLKEQGHTVYDCTVNDGKDAHDVLEKITAKCNSVTADLNISIHFNAGSMDKDSKTTGTEVMVFSASSKAVEPAKRVVASIAKLGFTNRGIVIRPDLYVLKHTKAPTILVECCFTDDKDDVKLYDADKMAKAIVEGVLGAEIKPVTSNYTAICGTAVATAAQMQTYLRKVNPSVSESVLSMLPLYISEGDAEGIRGDIAFAQSCLETGNFAFKPSDTAVKLSQNNFCGMGVTSYGVKGNSFSSPQMGVRAQVQHLKAYACKTALVNTCVDPRFTYVTRGSAQYVEWLGIKENPKGVGWAAGADYGAKILRILSAVMSNEAISATSTASQPEALYRVRKSWEDSKSQIGAFSELDKAKTVADKNAGYNVYDSNGKLVYPVAKKGYTGMYRVRASEDDLKSQKGAFTSLANAKACCDKYSGYMVFEDNGAPVYPLPFVIATAAERAYYKKSDGAEKAGTAAAGKYTIVDVDVDTGYGKLKSGVGWIQLTNLKEITTNASAKPGDKVVTAGKTMAKYMLAHGYRYKKARSNGFKVNESISASFRKSVSANNPTCHCTGGASWAFQIAGFLKEGVIIGHHLEHKEALIDCEILHPRKTGKQLIAEKFLRPGDFVLSSKDTCNGNTACIFAGYNADKKYWLEWGGPFRGRNCKGGTGENRNDYINIGPVEIPYDESRIIEHVIRPIGAGNGGIDISSIIK